MRLISHLSKSIRAIGHTHASFAVHADLARATIQNWVAGNVREINVTTLGKVATALGTVDIRKIFTLMDDTSEFLRPFKETRKVTFLLGTHDVEEAPSRTRTTIDVWDVRTQNEFLDHLREHVPDIQSNSIYFSNDSFGKKEQRDVLALAKAQNVVVIGSPKVNPACEFLTGQLFKRSGRKKSGPRLRLSEHGLAQSILGAPQKKNPCAIDLETGARLAEVKSGATSSLDAGIVTVVQQPWHGQDAITLVTISGISACGTYGAMLGLIENPPHGQNLVAGVPYERAFQITIEPARGSKGDSRKVKKSEPC